MNLIKSRYLEPRWRGQTITVLLQKKQRFLMLLSEVYHRVLLSYAPFFTLLFQALAVFRCWGHFMQNRDPWAMPVNFPAWWETPTRGISISQYLHVPCSQDTCSGTQAVKCWSHNCFFGNLSFLHILQKTLFQELILIRHQGREWIFAAACTAAVFRCCCYQGLKFIMQNIFI